MKRLLILTILGVVLASTPGCKFWDCLWRGPQYRNCPQQTVPCNPCPTYYPCDANPCCGMSGATAAPTATLAPTSTVAPGPESTFVPSGR
jgi:hypothetical protein